MQQYLPLILVVVVIAAAVMAVFLVIRGLADRRRERFRQRVGELAEEGGPPVLAEFVGQSPKDWSGRMDQSFKQMVQRTGLGWSTEQAVGLMALAGIALGAALLLWRNDLWLFGVGLILGMGVPLLVYLILQARWRAKIQEQMPDAFFLLARSIRAGLSLEMALTTVAENGNRPLSDEIRKGTDQIKYGLSVPAAMQGVANRIRLPDFDVFVTVITLHRTLGGNLAQLLDKVATTTRDRNLFRGYFRAATALGRLTAYFIAAAAPAILIGYAIWQPEFIARLTSSTAGVRALVIALVLEIIGAIWLFFLLRVDY